MYGSLDVPRCLWAPKTDRGASVDCWLPQISSTTVFASEITVESARKMRYLFFFKRSAPSPLLQRTIQTRLEDKKRVLGMPLLVWLCQLNVEFQ